MMGNDRNPDSGPDIENELRQLGRHLVIPAPDPGTVSAVLARIDREPVPDRRHLTEPGDALSRWLHNLSRWLHNRWRAAGVMVISVLLIVLAVSPAGAAIREWLGLGAVVVEQDQPAAGAPSESVGTTPLQSGADAEPEGTQMTLEQAREVVSYPVAVPTALGLPERLTVAPDGRMVTMQWSAAATGPIRLDQIDGSLSPYYVKKYYEDVTFTLVDQGEALWFATSHPIVVLDPDGTERVQSARRSGPTLLWQREGVTLRLEGLNDQRSAVTVAESLPD